MRISIFLLMGCALLFLTACNSPSGKTDKGVANNVTGKAEKALPAVIENNKAIASKSDQNQLIGEWIRSDGGYTLRIINSTSDGKLEAGYFNPSPIHVARAEWVNKENNLFVFVELRDVNYPGSSYTLKFFPAEGKLAGNYFQAVEGVNYEVEFVKAVQNIKP